MLSCAVQPLTSDDVTESIVVEDGVTVILGVVSLVLHSQEFELADNVIGAIIPE